MVFVDAVFANRVLFALSNKSTRAAADSLRSNNFTTSSRLAALLKGVPVTSLVFLGVKVNKFGDFVWCRPRGDNGSTAPEMALVANEAAMADCLPLLYAPPGKGCLGSIPVDPSGWCAYMCLCDVLNTPYCKRQVPGFRITVACTRALTHTLWLRVV